jgi:D-galacturonate reductase
MKYSPAEDGSFDGQRGYGYLSFEKWIDAVAKVNKGEVKPEQYDQYGLPTIKNT